MRRGERRLTGGGPQLASTRDGRKRRWAGHRMVGQGYLRCAAAAGRRCLAQYRARQWRGSYEVTDRGWIAYLNDLHKGRHTGAAWSWFLDVFAVAAIVFCVSGLLLLQLHSKRRPATWPVVGLGFCNSSAPAGSVFSPLKVRTMRLLISTALTTLVAGSALAGETIIGIDIPRLNVVEYHNPMSPSGWRAPMAAKSSTSLSGTTPSSRTTKEPSG